MTSFALVNSAGAELVSAGGSATSTTLSTGGYLVVLPGGEQSNTVQSGGAIVWTGVVAYRPDAGVTSYGPVATDVVVGDGTTEYVLPGGTASANTVNSGNEIVYSGGTAISTTISTGGNEIVTDSGTASFTMVSAGGSEVVSSGGIASFTAISSGGFEVLSNGGTASFTTVSSGGDEAVASGGLAVSTTLSLGGVIDLTDLLYVSGGSASVTSTGLLTVSVGGETYMQQLVGGYAGGQFQLATDGNSGTLITAGPVKCFRAGTRILTDHGEVAVEVLRIGDLVRTVLDEATAPIIWIGHRDVDCARHPQPRKVWPVRISAGAFGPGRPGRDLFLSPDHAVYVNRVLIPVRHLINARSIVQVPMDRVSYHHIELAQHDVVLAHGLPTETFLDLKDGADYGRGPAPTRLYPDHSARMWEAFGCARLIITGPEFLAARASVARIATQRQAA
jgi:autotransporter passenger strand-loop-strand repeat protein